MRQRKMLIVLALALTSGLAAAWMAWDLLKERTDVPQMMARGDSQVRIVVAARDLPPGVVLSEQDVALIHWPASSIPAGYARSVAEVVGRGLIVPVQAHEPLLDRKLASPDGGGGLPIAIPQGMRAISVKVDEVIGVAGFVVPGTRVDVIVTLNPRDQVHPTTSRVVLQNILTLASGTIVEQTPEREPTQATVITLLVDPDQAELLALAANEGQIQLALRNSMDVAEAYTPGARLTSLLGVGRPAPPVAAVGGRRPAAPLAADRGGVVVELYKADSRSTLKF